MSSLTSSTGVAGLIHPGAQGPAAPQGFQRLATSQLAAANATITSVSFPPKDLLYVVIRITGYSNTDRPMMQFNGATTGYWHRWITNPATTTNTATTSTPANVQGASAAGVHIAGTDVTTSRIVSAMIANVPGFSHPIIMEDLTGGGAATSVTTQVNHLMGGGEWSNTAQITSMLVVTVAGRTLSAGSSLTVFGRDVHSQA